VYRILTENKNVDQVQRMLCGLGLDYTVYYGEGAWQGHRENGLMIELIMSRKISQKKPRG
jgi:hypothetical protein